MGRKISFSLFLCLLLSSILAVAQETTGGIQGTVKDPQGAVVPGATVTVSSQTLIGKKTATSDSGGFYHVEQLPPGIYSITVAASGFTSETKQNLRLETGALPIVNFDLKVGTAAETVEVSSASEMVDVTQSKVATTVSSEILQNIPVGRSFQSVIPFAAGARQEPLQGGTSSRTNGFQIDGASDSENVYLIDGINTTDIQNGGIGKNFQMEFVQEVQIKSSSFEAEYGGALGGVINAVPKRGSNAWHGEVLTYLRTNDLNANDPCASGYTSGGAGTFAGFSTTCGLRLDPTKAGTNTTTRLDGTPQYYVPKKDDRRILEPGFSVGGPILKDRLWLFTSYIPTLDRIRRTTTFTGANAGARTLKQTFAQHNLYSRLDYRAFDSLRLFAGWNYAYSRSMGQLGQPDSAYNQVNAGASTDPTTLHSNFGSVDPLSVYTFGGDWTPTSKMVVSTRFGYFFSNDEQRGRPTGTQYLYDLNSLVKDDGSALATNKCTKDINGNCFPTSAPFNTSGFANIPSTFTQFFNAYKRKSLNLDTSYFVSSFGGSHTLKGGYFWQHQSNDTLSTFNTASVRLEWGTNYSPVTSTTACDAIIAQNAANPSIGPTNAAKAGCQGQYGYYIVRDGVDNTGKDTQSAQALYLQDAWTVGHGLTLNLGVRFDEERQPPYDPKRFPTVDFGWGQKIAPRIGGAYDLLHNGKVKVYASYGKFYDIMKMGLARGSFGSDYWHDCVYTLDSFNYTAITPSAPVIPVNGGAPAPHACPPSGPAPGVTVGRFIENVDFRATKADPRDPAINPATLKPMLQHEFVTGADWAVSSNWSLESRYSRKRLDNTIEDMAITDNLGFYIGNPGSTIADVLHRPVVLDSAVGPVGPFCAECPPVVKAIRRYDGLEFRLAKRPGGRWFGAVSYSYSRLTGNYAGLTNSDPTDGGGGRHSPNNGRAFDIPTQTYLPSGKIDDGPLSTDRPHTGKIYAYYRLPWWGHQETTFGFIQTAFQGTPIDSCLPVVGSSSACQWAEGRGNFAKLHRDPNTGDIVKDGVVHDARTSPLFQTDFTLRHEIPVSRNHENMRVAFEGDMFNLLNNRGDLGYYEFVIPTNLINPSRPARFTGDPGTDWGKVMNGYDYIAALNATGAFTGVQGKRTFASRYGMPQIFQQARNIRLGLKFTF